MLARMRAPVCIGRSPDCGQLVFHEGSELFIAHPGAAEVGVGRAEDFRKTWSRRLGSRAFYWGCGRRLKGFRDEPAGKPRVVLPALGSTFRELSLLLGR